MKLSMLLEFGTPLIMSCGEKAIQMVFKTSIIILTRQKLDTLFKSSGLKFLHTIGLLILTLVSPQSPLIEQAFSFHKQEQLLTMWPGLLEMLETGWTIALSLVLKPKPPNKLDGKCSLLLKTTPQEDSSM